MTIASAKLQGNPAVAIQTFSTFSVERSYQTLGVDGRLGYLVPSAIYHTEGCTGLRHLMFENVRVTAFYGFENRHKLFPIDSCFVIQKLAACGPQRFQAAFMRHQIEELLSGAPPGVEVEIARDEIERISPGTLSFPEYRTGRDREIVLKMHGLGEARVPRPLLGGNAPGSWGVVFHRELNLNFYESDWPSGRPKKAESGS